MTNNNGLLAGAETTNDDVTSDASTTNKEGPLAMTDARATILMMVQSILDRGPGVVDSDSLMELVCEY